MNLSSPTRRSFLRGTGVILGLPFLESLAPAADTTRRRIVAIDVGLGLHAPNIIPKQSGRDYETPVYLKPLADLREQLTIISGVSNPEVGGGHHSYKSFLTGAPHPNSAGFRNTISLDQYAAARLGSETRFASLTLSNSGPGLSWSRTGVEIPAIQRPSEVFAKLFLTGKPSEIARQRQHLADGRSVLDTVMDKTRRMERRLGGRDKAKLDQYFEAVREAERRLEKAELWNSKPKPKTKLNPPSYERDRKNMIVRMRQLYDVMHLALETDSTRFITLNLPGMNSVPTIHGRDIESHFRALRSRDLRKHGPLIDIDYHNLSHHGRDPEKIRQLTIVESVVVDGFAELVKKLAASQDGGGSLLDGTMVMFGSNLGNASSHDTRNLPIVLAGGGFKHGRHLAFDQEDNHPLTNLYVSMLHRLGLETNAFSTGTRPMPGLDFA